MCEARTPCLRNFWPWLSPGVPGGTMKLAWPRVPSAGSTAATTTCTSAMPPLVAHDLVPLSTHSSLASRYSARVRIEPMSLPASGSEAQNAPSFTSSALPNISGSHSPTCSGVPLLATATAASVLPTRDSAMPASPQNSSSKATGIPSPLGSSHCPVKKSSEYSPILAASCRTGQGVCSRSSHSAPAGRITSAAKPCTQSRISRTSGPGSRENPGLAGGVLMRLLTAGGSAMLP